MSSEDKFKELLNQKLGDKVFAFNPDSWEKAKQLIDAKRRQKRRALWLFFSLLLCVGIGSFYLLLPAKTAAPALSQATTALHSQAATATPAAPAEEATPNTAAKTTEPAYTPNQPEEKTAAATSPVMSETTEHAAPAHKAASVSEPAEVIEKASRPAATKVAKQDKIPELKDKKQMNMQPPAKTVQDPMAQKSESRTDAPDKTPLEKAPESSRKTEEPAAAPPVAEQTTEEPAAKKPDEKPAELAPAEPLATATPQQQVPAPEQTPATTQPESEQPQAQPAKAIDTVAVAAKKDTIGTTAAVAAPPVEQMGYPKNLLFVEAGTNGLAGWKSGGKRDAAGFNPVLGIGYMNFINETFAVSLGIQYTSVGNLKNYSHTSKTTNLGFGEQGAVMVITPTRLHYLAFPLKFNVFANPQNAFGFGYTLGYLMTVESKVETYNQDQISLSSTHNISRKRGYADGFSKYDSQLSVFYRRSLYKNFALNAEFLFGLSDVKKNSFFANSTKERNMGVKLTLMYHLFKK